MTAKALGLEYDRQPMTLSTASEANRNIGVLDNALHILSKQRQTLEHITTEWNMQLRGL